MPPTVDRHRLALLALASLALTSAPSAGAEQGFYVSPAGSDDGAGTQAAPFQTLFRAQAAVREAAPAMDRDIVVNVAPGVYRLDKTLELTEADSGRNGHRVVYRSAGGLGKARILGSVPLTGWQPHRDGIWKVELPEGMSFNTLYENGQRAWKARFPNYEHHPNMPTARGRYLVSVDGSPTSAEGETTGWLIYRPEDAPPVTEATKMKTLVYTVGKCDWFREVRKVLAIDPDARRIVLAGRFWRGVRARARFFLEDELGFLDAPGEFYIDDASHTLYYKPLGEDHPDALGIAAPVLGRLIQIKGKSRDACAERIVLDGLALEETDDSPCKSWWSTHYGRRDGALVWMGNTKQIEVRNCHLKNSGRNGVMMIGHNVGNRVIGCWIEHMGVNGVTLCDLFTSRDKKSATQDRCERNRVHNCHIHHIGEIHCYAGCVNAFGVSQNEVSHCELHDSVRYAVTVRGNTGKQYGPPVWVNKPYCKDNRFHHLRVYRCGQDSGDMGALHCAQLNNPGGPAVNTFEQIVVADSRAIPSMHDSGPGGIFLDWPKMSMEQIFRNVHIVRSQSQQVRSNGSDNAASAQTENVSWKPGFLEERMDYESIGLTDEFPAEYGGRPAAGKPLSAPRNVAAKATAYDTVVLEWEAPADAADGKPTYSVYRDDERVGQTQALRFTDHALCERTTYRYALTAFAGDFVKPSPLSQECRATTPADLEPPWPTGARIMLDGDRVRVAFSEAVDPVSAAEPSHYRFEPPLAVESATLLRPGCVQLKVDGLDTGTAYALSIVGVRDASAAGNGADGRAQVAVGQSGVVVSYPMKRIAAGWLPDASGGGGDARLYGNVTIEPNHGPFGGPAVRFDGKTGYAEAPADLNLGDGDFTIMLWVFRLNSGIILSKGNGFGDPRQWSLGWPKDHGGIALRVENNFFSTGAGSVPVGQWVHLALVKRGTTLQVYANGKPSGEEHDLSEVGPFVNDRPLRIGRREYGPTPTFFNGRVSRIMLLDSALALEEIRTYAEGKTE